MNEEKIQKDIDKILKKLVKIKNIFFSQRSSSCRCTLLKDGFSLPLTLTIKNNP